MAGHLGQRQLATRRAVATAIAGLLVITFLSPSAISSPKAEDTSVKWAPTDVGVSKAATLFRGEQKSLYEPAIAIDPTNPNNVLAFAIDLSVQNVNDRLWSVTRGYRSTNGGRTWVDKGPLDYTNSPRDAAKTDSGDPVVAFDSNGTAYYASLASPPGRPGGIYVHRSRNGGASWEKPSVAVSEIEDEDKDICTGTDKEWLSIDPRTGDLYLTYTLFTYSCSGLGDPLGADTFTRLQTIDIFLTRSQDGGRSWSKPREIWHGYALGAIPRVGPDGTLYTAFWATVVSPPSACPTALGTATVKGGGRPFAAIVMGSSKDRGKTWTYHHESVCGPEPALLTKPGRFVGGFFLPALSVDPVDGNAYVVYPSYLPDEQRVSVLLSRSTDGETWSEPVELTPGDMDALIPTVVARDGVVYVTYVQTTPEEKGDTFFVQSNDSGATWTRPFRLSTESADLALDPEVGDYNTLDVSDGRIAAIWTDARKGTHGEIWARVGELVPLTEDSIESMRTIAVAPAAAAPPSFAGMLQGFMPSYATNHRWEPTPVLSVGSDGACGRLGAAMRIPEPRRVSSWSIRVDCSIDHAFEELSSAATKDGYEIVFEDFEGFEAELLLQARRLLLVKLLASPLGVDSTQVLMYALD